MSTEAMIWKRRLEAACAQLAKLKGLPFEVVEHAALYVSRVETPAGPRYFVGQLQAIDGAFLALPISPSVSASALWLWMAGAMWASVDIAAPEAARYFDAMIIDAINRELAEDPERDYLDGGGAVAQYVRETFDELTGDREPGDLPPDINGTMASWLGNPGSTGTAPYFFDFTKPAARPSALRLVEKPWHDKRPVLGCPPDCERCPGEDATYICICGHHEWPDEWPDVVAVYDTPKEWVRES